MLPFMAEREGFEPSVPVRVQRFSRPSRSTTPAPLLTAGLIGSPYRRRNRVQSDCLSVPAQHMDSGAAQRILVPLTGGYKADRRERHLPVQQRTNVGGAWPDRDPG